MNNTRLNSISVVGGAFGDEGKGKIVDEICTRLVNRFDGVVVYRWNGGSNAGHTVELKDRKITLHQIPSGSLVSGATCILGKGMVIHPADLSDEMELIPTENRKGILIDEMVTLSLDTHRAFEAALKMREEGGAGSTGKGISPAYADIIFRHPIRARDLLNRNWKEVLGKHFLLYRDLVKGLGKNISNMVINPYAPKKTTIGSKETFLKGLESKREVIGPYVKNIHTFLTEKWASKTPFVFEGAQGVGLDLRWGVYPDVTASDPTPTGIAASTEGIVDPNTIEIRANVYKATYTSSVGKRILPTKMNESLARRIREDANEYGSTTKRPRDIYHIDLPALRYFAKVSNATHMVLTHMDISYADTPIKVCAKYTDKNGNEIDYRPDQVNLNLAKPNYIEFSPWDGKRVSDTNSFTSLPHSSLKYVSFLAKELNLDPLMLTTRPKRDSVINTNYLLL